MLWHLDIQFHDLSSRSQVQTRLAKMETQCIDDNQVDLDLQGEWHEEVTERTQYTVGCDSSQSLRL